MASGISLPHQCAAIRRPTAPRIDDFHHTTGELALVEQYGFDGVLPEHAAFDADGDALSVVVYNERENPMNPGYIEFWNVTEGDGTPALERTGARIDVVRGPHTMAVVR